jgi:hypothetical protein
MPSDRLYISDELCKIQVRVHRIELGRTFVLLPAGQLVINPTTINLSTFGPPAAPLRCDLIENSN